MSEPILTEVERVLQRKFGWPPEDIAEARRRLQAMARAVTPAVQLDVIAEDPPDNRVLECAVSSSSDFFITGDKDLLRLGRYDAICIVSVADFLEQQWGHTF